MKAIVLLTSVLFWTTFSFGQAQIDESMEDLQKGIMELNALIETACHAVEGAYDDDIVKQHADQIRAKTKGLIQKVQRVYTCENPNFGKNLVLSYALADISPQVSQLYYYKAFFDQECPDAREVYINLLDDIQHLAWRVKFSSKEKTLERLTTRLETVNQELASL